MKKYRVITRQVIHQEWEYEVEVPDGFENNRNLSKLLGEKIHEDGIEGHCLDNDEVMDEIVVDWKEIEA